MVILDMAAANFKSAGDLITTTKHIKKWSGMKYSPAMYKKKPPWSENVDGKNFLGNRKFRRYISIYVYVFPRNAKDNTVFDANALSWQKCNFPSAEWIEPVYFAKGKKKTKSRNHRKIRISESLLSATLLSTPKAVIWLKRSANKFPTFLMWTTSDITTSIEIQYCSDGKPIMDVAIQTRNITTFRYER